MANVCQIRVNSVGQYCCDVKHLTVMPGCVGNIKFSNLPEVTIEYEVTEDNWIPAVIPSISGDGCETLFKAGEYRFNIDCADYDGVEAPAEDAVGLCYECCKVDDWDQILSAQMEALCGKLLASDDTAANAEMIQQLSQICDKLLAQGVVQAEMLTSLQALCDKIEAGNEEQLACLEEIKEAVVCPPATARGVLTTW